MTIVLNLTPEKEAELQARAAAQGQGVEDYVLATVLPAPEQKFLPPPYDKAAAIALLDSWMAEDDPEAIREQRETLAYLERVVDEDRPGQRTAFGKGYDFLADRKGQPTAR